MNRLGDDRCAEHPMTFEYSDTLCPFLKLAESEDVIILSGPRFPNTEISKWFTENTFTISVKQTFHAIPEESIHVTHLYPGTLVGRSEHTFTVPQGIAEPLPTHNYEEERIRIKLLKKNYTPANRENKTGKIEYMGRGEFWAPC